MMRYLWASPRALVLLPIAMVLMNLVQVVSGIVAEGGVIKHTQSRFMVMYALTIPHAVRGDLVPFMQILCMPG